ncbi:hypothetical protein JJJ17_15780 [Paracoccus caeni]|uniref:Uncharacterized protein n=1 Tax=Paracoccus caeni TaxID=657651 RepID=A0A934SGW1_9RHOB|nr:hypothetical protein [Paracoccus caeni]MBK4217388.1 hypothetical protein [Paracoccus caeni]
MHKTLLVGALTLIALPAQAEIVSEYTSFDPTADCHVIAQSDEGPTSDRVCKGYGNYPVFLTDTDGRQTVTVGFANDRGMPTFSRFNYAGDKIEWRIDRNGAKDRPYAAIQRWFLADAEGEWTTELLAVYRVGQPAEGGACTIGYLSGQNVNERARELADAKAADFTCGTDQPDIDAALESDIAPQ